MMRICIGPGEVAGYFSGLKVGFDALGIDSEHFLFLDTKFGYEQHSHFLKRTCRAASDLRRRKNVFVNQIGLFLSILVRILIFLYAIFRFDVFIFFGSWSFFGFRDFPVLKLLGKKIIVVYVGSDARPPFFSGRHLDDEGGLIDATRAKVETDEICRKIRVVERYADYVINHTATDQLFTREYIRFAAVGLPIRSIERKDGSLATDRVKILHAPSRPIAKGTSIFRQAIEELRHEGCSIEFVELTGVANQVVLNEIANCDFIVDQLYSDTPMAMFATEAAMLGKPAVVGGYYAAHYAVDNADVERPPSLYVCPGDIKDAIRRLIEDREFRIALGEKARMFVRSQWAAATVAQRFLQIAEGRAPASWFSRPRDTGYIWGWGLSQEAWCQQVGQYIRCNGWEATFLEQNWPVIRKIKHELSAAEISLHRQQDMGSLTNAEGSPSDLGMPEGAPRA